MKRMKQFLLVFITIFSIVFATSAATFTVTSTADAGAGTLRQALQDAAGNAAAPHTIVFSVPAGSIITINSNLQINNSANVTGLTINGFIDAVPGPDVIIRGSGATCNNLRGIEINNAVSGLRIYGLVFQNLDYGIFYNSNQQGTALNSEIKGCYFGLNLAGTAIQNGICRSGIHLQGASTVTIGGLLATLANGTGTASNNSERNLFAGNSLENFEGNGVRTPTIKSVNSNNVVIQNNYFGIDINGTTKLGSGNQTAKKPLAHSHIYFNNSFNGVIDRNVISGATGCGIHLENNSSFTKVKGNFIGTNAAGTAAYNASTPSLSFSNEACGIFIQGSDNITIGFDGGIIANERNIISGNGGAKHNDFNPTCDRGFNDYNQYGIYGESVRNCVIKGNYIGTNVTGNSTGTGNIFGNRSGGIKLVSVNGVGASVSTGNIVGGGNTVNDRNIISGNGYVWSVSDNTSGCNGSPIPSGIQGGPGIVLQYPNTNNNTVSGNYIGLGADGETRLGNKDSGVEILGAANNLIGAVGVPNYIADNTWGVFLQVDYDGGAANDPARNNTVQSNIIGLTVSNAIAGNGTRVGLTDGGGVGMQMGVTGNIIGTATAGGGNIIAGNRNGVLIQYNEQGTTMTAPNGNFVYNNRIGADATGAAKPNGGGTGEGYGIIIRRGPSGTIMPYNNIIGGAGANQRNFIVNNDQAGILISNDVAIVNSNPGNQIIGNYIGTLNGTTAADNNTNGIEITNVSGSNATNGTLIRGNVISGNTQNGIALNNADFNTIQTNVIGGTSSATPAALSNGQNGIQLTNGSSSNIIGGVAGTLALPTEANFIGFNGSNGVSIAGATSNLNSIHRNAFQCNTLRGIELNGSGNNGYAAPTISGNPTAITVTGPTGSTIELYSTDGCATCPANPTRLQGLVLVAVGASPLAFTPVNGVLYTAVAHQANTTTAHNSSEFSQCYTLCSAPTPSIVGTTTLCENVTGVVFSTTNNASNTYTWTAPAGVTITSGAGTNSITVSIGNFPITGSIQVTESAGAGCSGIATAPLTIRDNPTVSNAGTNQNICGTSVSLTGNTPTVGTGLWTVSPAAGVTIASPTAAATTASGLVQGTNYTFTWTVSNAPCANSASSVTINNRQNPTAATASAPANICGTSVSLTGNTPTVGTGLWTVTPATGVTIASPSTAATSVSGLTQGVDYTFTWTISNAPCTATSASAVVSNKSNPSTATAGSNQSICGTSVSLTGNTPTIGSGQWTVSPAAGVTIASPTTASTTASGLVQGTNYTFTWTISNAPCTASTSNVTITNSASPTTANAGSNADNCGPTVSLVGNTPTVGTGLWTVNPSAGVTIASPTTASTSVSGLTQGVDYTFTWTISNAPCTASTSSVVISNKANPTTSVAGSNQDICGSTVTLAGNTPTVGTGLWSVTPSTGITIANPGQANTSVSGLTPGNSYTFTWNIFNSPCTASASSVTIRTDNQASTVNAGPDIIGCQITSGNLGGVAPSSGTASWVVTEGTGLTFTNATSPTSTVNGIVAGQSYRVAWVASGNLNICPVTSDTVVIRSDLNPTNVNAGNDTTLCNSGTVTLTSTGAPGVWSVNSGTATITAPSSNTSSVTFTGSTATLAWTVTNGSCSAEDLVVLSRTDLPTPAILGDLSHCASTTNIELTATPDVTTSGGSYVWDIVTGSGDASITSSTTTNPINVSSGLIGGIVRVRITQGGCINVATQAAITIDSDNTIANAGPDLTTCLDSVRLVGNTPLFGSPSWSVINEPSIVFTPTANNDTTFAETLVNGTVYRFVYTISGACGLPSRDTVIVNAGLTGFVLADVNGPSDTLCSTTARTLSAVVTGGSGDFTYVWTGSNGFRTTTNSPILSVVPNANVVTYQVYVIDNANTGCQTGTDATIVYAVDKQNLEIMNLVTPNNDGKNDIFIVRDKVTLQDLIPQGSYLEVYNRWGDRVFKANDYKNNWNCAELSDGMYFYLLQTECGNQEYKGWVHILGNTNN